jgi:hypothetical protein
MDFAGLIYEIFCHRKSLLAFFIVGIGGIIAAIYYMARPFVRVEQEESAGLRIHMLTTIDDYFAINPYEGWQNTKIQLRKGQLFSVNISGQVSPGNMQNFGPLQKYIDERTAWDNTQPHQPGQTAPIRPEMKWPFSDPSGYKDSQYPSSCPSSDPAQKAPPRTRQGILWNYKCDPGLTVMGLPHNTVIGIILPPTLLPTIARYDATVQHDLPGYEWDNTKNTGTKNALLNLSSEQYPLNCKAASDGYLWVTINDADAFRFDNSGEFFMKVTRYPTESQSDRSLETPYCK